MGLITKKTFINLLSVALLLSACNKGGDTNIDNENSNSNSNTNTNTNTNNNGRPDFFPTPPPTVSTTPVPTTPPPFSGDCYLAPGIDNPTGPNLPYYSFEITGRGRGNDPGKETLPSWTSFSPSGWSRGFQSFTTYTTTQPTFNTDFLVTDSRLNVRVIAKSHPGLQGNCPFSDPYNALDVTVGVRHPDSMQGQYLSITTFSDLALDQCPLKRSLTVPAGLGPDDRLILEVLNVKWDRCGNGWYPPNSTQNCEMNRVWHQNCFRMILQYSTDSTKDLPNY